jgi:hypothetical protein
MPRQTNSPQSRERRLRRLAQRVGLEIRKVGTGRERGRFHLDPLDTDIPAYKRKNDSPSMTLDEVEARLDSLMGGASDRDDDDES